MTADTVDPRASGPGDPPGDSPGTRWAPGEQILWRYRANGSRYPHICRPVTVVQDTPALLAVWLAPGTACVKPELADGTPLHLEPLSTRYTKPRTTALSWWRGTGVLKLARPGDAWSVWLFWDGDWRFKNYYVNLEEPHRRWAGGIDSEDHFLDIAVSSDGRWELLDEDEFEQAQLAGLMDEAQAERVRAAGRAAVEAIRAWRPPFPDGWEHWRPDPHWAVPPLPDDWDRDPAAMERTGPRGAGGRPGKPFVPAPAERSEP
ncbi:DUF402 domain-containing protein [Streptomyces sp. N2-109]|uniref:DUF402 domain-containing protein n=1 Tax=Streptomyces gossypii TaxID=2883101 RepID=A0ABT2JVT7_9ACTN|nr:DUF402 domain-containing protein [Streptomyces gossypii]MCT2591980.1 DUF402 domain-containing protein [Streptomyces gossypii]